jgi:hypothetical protein
MERKIPPAHEPGMGGRSTDQWQPSSSSTGYRRKVLVVRASSFNSETGVLSLARCHSARRSGRLHNSVSSNLVILRVQNLLIIIVSISWSLICVCGQLISRFVSRKYADIVATVIAILRTLAVVDLLTSLLESLARTSQLKCSLKLRLDE